MASGKRNAGEAFKVYRERLQAENERLKAQAKAGRGLGNGPVLWDVEMRGTYVRAQHGALGV